MLLLLKELLKEPVKAVPLGETGPLLNGPGRLD